MKVYVYDKIRDDSEEWGDVEKIVINEYFDGYILSFIDGSFLECPFDEYTITAIMHEWTNPLMNFWGL